MNDMPGTLAHTWTRTIVIQLSQQHETPSWQLERSYTTIFAKYQNGAKKQQSSWSSQLDKSGSMYIPPREHTSGEQRETSRGTDRSFPFLVLTCTNYTHHDCQIGLHGTTLHNKEIPSLQGKTALLPQSQRSFILPDMECYSRPTLCGKASPAERTNKLQKREARVIITNSDYRSLMR